jgi:hypothetical protein
LTKVSYSDGDILKEETIQLSTSEEAKVGDTFTAYKRNVGKSELLVGNKFIVVFYECFNLLLILLVPLLITALIKRKNV